MKGTLVVAVVSAVCLLATCGHASDLSRPEAKRILDKVVAAQPPVNGFSLSTEQMQRLRTVDAAILNKAFVFLSPPENQGPYMALVPNSGARSIADGGQRCLPDGGDMRLMSGQFVQCLNILNPAEITWQRPGILLRLKAGVSARLAIIEITGIADGSAPNEKLVEDTWKYDLSQLSKEIDDAVKPATNAGTALFRLYDDGWRFVRFEK